MQAKKIVLEVLRIIVVLVTWFVLVLFSYVLAQGPEPAYDLGNGYKMIRWPGPIDRWNFDEDVPIEKMYQEKMIGDDKAEAFYVNTNWIVGRTRKGWFAINKQTHKVYYPYQSHSELCAVTGFDFSPDDLIKRYPIEYEIIWPHTKRLVSIICILMIIPLIGFRRCGRILMRLFSQGQKKHEEVRPSG